MKAGENQIEVLVCNTLANHYTTVPTWYCGQTTSGLLGPAPIEMTRWPVSPPQVEFGGNFHLAFEFEHGACDAADGVAQGKLPDRAELTKVLSNPLPDAHEGSARTPHLFCASAQSLSRRARAAAQTRTNNGLPKIIPACSFAPKRTRFLSE